MATTYTAEVVWQRGEGEDFLANRYSRRHLLRFDGGAEWAGSSSPHIVPQPLSDASAVDPEEAFVASLAACHMLWFLSIAAKNRYDALSYTDTALGFMARNAEGKLAMTRVTLRPDARFGGARLPDKAEIDRLHHEAHAACFIANSVKTEVRCEPVYPV